MSGMTIISRGLKEKLVGRRYVSMRSVPVFARPARCEEALWNYQSRGGSAWEEMSCRTWGGVQPQYNSLSAYVLRGALTYSLGLVAAGLIASYPYCLILQEPAGRVKMNRKAYARELMSIYGTIPEARRADFSAIFAEREKNQVLAFGCNAWLGGLGIDRFYVGQPVLGIIKLITLGGFGIWVLIDFFLIGGVARERSIEIARSIRDSMRV